MPVFILNAFTTKNGAKKKVEKIQLEKKSQSDSLLVNVSTNPHMCIYSNKNTLNIFFYKFGIEVENEFGIILIERSKKVTTFRRKYEFGS